MPETALFDALPGTDALTGTLAALPTSFDPASLGVDTAGLGEELRGSASAGEAAPALPDLSGAPSPAGFRRALDEPLSRATALDGPSLLESARSSLPPALPAPAFDVNGVVQKITTPILGSDAGTPANLDVPLPAQLGDFSAPVRRLAEAGAATPLRLLQALLTVLDRLVATATDVDKLKEYTAEALSEILISQCQELKGRLPLASLEQARAALGDGFLDRFEQVVAELDRVKAASGPELLAAVEAARTRVQPGLQQFGRAAATFTAFKADDAAALERSLKNVAGFATSDQVFLKEVFDGIETRVGGVIDAVARPVQDLAAMIAQIRSYLEQAATTAESGARAISQKLDETLNTVTGHLETAQERIDEIAKQVQAFVEKVDVGPAIEAFKSGCTRVVDGVDRFFTEVERARQQLDEAVTRLSADLEGKFDEGLRVLQEQIRGLLGEITGLLERDEVKDVLEQAREGVEKLKSAIDQASLQSVFDLVIRKTGELEGKVQAIDTSRLGTPQKTALKIGVKIIQEVNIDDVVRPELEAAAHEILEPVRELIALLRDKVLIIEEKIDAFAPGTLLANTVEPYLAPLFRALESFRPSQLLEPIKDALAALQGVLEQLDPQRVIDQLQGAFQQLQGLVDALEPTPLTAEINRAANTVVRQIEEVRDVYLEQILQAIRDNVSLEKLLQGTGIQEIADADFWDMLRRVLGGEYLDRLKEAMDTVETQLSAEFATLDYRAAAAAVADASKAVDAQARIGADNFRGQVTAFTAEVEGVLSRVGELETRRKAVLAGAIERPEVEAALRALELQPLLDLLAALRGAAGVTETASTAALTRVKNLCKEHQVAIREMTEAKIRESVPAIFRTQIGDPVRGFVTRMQEKLQPFADAVTAIQDFVRTVLQELPRRIDAAVAGVLDTLRTDLRGAAGEVIDTVRALRDAITQTITKVYEQVKKQVDKLDPTGVLNSFAATDFVGEGDAPAGLAALAGFIAAPGSATGVAGEAAALLHARLTSEQLELVDAKRGAYSVPVLEALNGALRDAAFASRLQGQARARLDAERQRLEGELESATGDAFVARRKELIRTLALGRQLEAAQRAYAATATRAQGLVRLNRVLLEVAFPAELKMGLMALHPYVVEMVGQLYPTETVERIDATYARLVERIRKLPNELLKEPLDDAYNTVKETLHNTFDIRGLFRVLDIKLEGMEGDLSRGLDRLGVAYEHLLGTLDARLSA